MLCQLSCLQRAGNTLQELLQRERIHFTFFCLFTQFAQIKTVKILRKIKATLKRNKKSRSKQKQAQQQQAEQQSQQQRPSSSCCCSQQGDNCEKNLVDCNAMDSNLNRMINQSLRHPLSGQLSKYTNVMKGEVKEKQQSSYIFMFLLSRLAISLVHCGRQDGLPQLFPVRFLSCGR